VRHRIERMLSALHLRGAFSGLDADEAFRVVTDASVNPPQSLDLGRFVVELRVAPSRPLAFLRVRLLQRGPQELLVSEV
jgi:phage tail sheath protein FI